MFGRTAGLQCLVSKVYVVAAARYLLLLLLNPQLSCWPPATHQVEALMLRALAQQWLCMFMQSLLALQGCDTCIAIAVHMGKGCSCTSASGLPSALQEASRGAQGRKQQQQLQGCYQ